MGRTANIPAALRDGPFSLDEARAAGVSLSSLRGGSYERIGSRLYRVKGSFDKWALIRAFERELPGSAVFMGRTAAWIHGLDIEPLNPVQVAVPPPFRLASRIGVEIHQVDVRDEIVRMRGLSSTTIHRTLLDLCARMSPVEALVAIDMAFVAELTDKATLRHYAETAKGRRGVARLKSLAEIAAPAESPMETRLRWLLVNAGLPTPEVQTDLYDREGELIGQADLYYPSAHLVIEFDGGNHRDRLITDNRRQNSSISAGYRVLRFTSSDVYGRPHSVTAQVRAYLSGR